jgi:hypothetical protein
MEIATNKPGSRRKFSPEEDELLRSLVQEHGSCNWPKIASFMTGRSVRQCKERWVNYLSQVSDGPSWTLDDDLRLERMVIERGHKWKTLELHFPGKTDIQLKNRYNVIQRRRNRLFRIAFRSPRRDPSDQKTRANHGNESIGEFDIELDWTSEWSVDECADSGSWDSWMVGHFADFN